MCTVVFMDFPKGSVYKMEGVSETEEEFQRCPMNRVLRWYFHRKLRQTTYGGETCYCAICTYYFSKGINYLTESV